jgi:SAM-dependent methyltransferase
MNIDTLKRNIPWQAKLVAKIVLSRLPVPFSFWRRLVLFRHGSMQSGAYALDVFERHFKSSMISGGLIGKTLLELGPGDGIASGLLASIFGADQTILVDTGDYVIRDIHPYHVMLAEWQKQGMDTGPLQSCKSFDQLCRESRTTYLTGGLASLASIESSSVDIQFSNSVLQHVRRAHFDATLRELRRVLRVDGHASHEVDLRDHLGGGLNNLRFSDRIWESTLFSNSGFYTNRIRYSEMLQAFKSAGFRVEVTKEQRWPILPIARELISPRFQALTDEDLMISVFDVALG